MGAFCESCGAKLGPGIKFCAQCGQAVATTRAATPAAPASPPPAASTPAAVPAGKGGGNTARIIFAVLGVFTFFVLLAAGSCFYIGYRIKRRANELSQNYGLNTTPYHGKRDACALVTKAEVAEAFGTRVRDVQGSSDNCTYDLGGPRRVAINVTWEGGTMEMKLSHGALKSIAGMDTFTSVAGVGDEAYIEPMGSGLMLRKGDVMVNIDLRMAGQNAEAGKKIAAHIAGRL